MSSFTKIFTGLCVMLMFIPRVQGQNSALNGIVTDVEAGQALEGATVVLFQEGETVSYMGTATNSEGLYLIGRIDPGKYRLQISFIGFETHQEEIELLPGIVHTVSVALNPDAGALDEVLIESERTAGVARTIAGRQRITPEEIEMIPSPDISADLAGYMTTLPGVISIGDRGGQLFIRGGEPPQNLVLLDGMIVYQPFHVLGFYSAFPAEIIDKVDFYAGGFGSRYAGRMSSVLDVSARPGNNRRVQGMASISPFAGALRLEGPIYPGVASVILSARESLLDKTSNWLYKDELPFEFNDRFGKIQFTPGSRHRFTVSGFQSADSGRLVSEITEEEAQNIAWTNGGFSISWLVLSKNMPIATKLTLSHSAHEIEQQSPGLMNRESSIKNNRLTFDATFSEGAFLGGRTTTVAGWEMLFGRTSNEIDGLFQNLEDTGRPVPSIGLYIEPEIVFTNGLMLSPGIRWQIYNTRILPFSEPRLRAEYSKGIHHFSGALGIYNQQVIGLNDRRDPANVFTVWTGVPRDNRRNNQPGLDVLRDRIGRAIHAIIGYRANPVEGVEYAVEGFYKRYSNLFVAEWTAFPRLTTRLQTAIGHSFGGEVRAELQQGPFFGFVTYGYSNTKYAADGNAIGLLYGQDRLHYRPPHDRRHNVNALVSVQLEGVEMSLRWQFGSGLPYTRPLGFDGFALIDGIRPVFDVPASGRVIYDRPFGDELPTYHRLDFSIEKKWRFRNGSITLHGSAINLYDRRNIFYIDIFTLQRSDQLPFIPSVGLKVQMD